MEVEGGGGAFAVGEGVALRPVLEELARRGVLQAMVEGGAGLHSGVLRAGLADRVAVFVGATVLGAGSQQWLSHPVGDPTVGFFFFSFYSVVIRFFAMGAFTSSF